jgi:soluble lytic murein transglycosylase-like protein
MSINGIYAIESRIREIESKINVFAGEEKSYGNTAFSEVLKSSISNNEKISSTEVDGIIDRVSQKIGIDKELVKLVAKTESGKDQRAVSNRGAIGVMQLMPDTAKGLGVNPYNTEENIEGGAKYLKEMLSQFNGDVSKALAAYNAGPGAVKKYGGIPPYKETQNYVNKIMKEYRE